MEAGIAREHARRFTTAAAHLPAATCSPADLRSEAGRSAGPGATGWRGESRRGALWGGVWVCARSTNGRTVLAHQPQGELYGLEGHASLGWPAAPRHVQQPRRAAAAVRRTGVGAVPVPPGWRTRCQGAVLLLGLKPMSTAPWGVPATARQLAIVQVRETRRRRRKYGGHSRESLHCWCAALSQHSMVGY